ncbi:alpha/beta hydrolase [Rhizobium sp. SL42]|uniref:alpha/beta hydrolase n=1 Tax=Rhizobium sp. SL42 TaxID=2806346 RepID=UPI003FA6CE3D
MSTTHFRTAAISCVLFPFLLVQAFATEPLKPFKDDLFSSQTVLDSRDGGDFTIVDYQELRDINGRDSIPERRVKDRYVSLAVRRVQENQTLQLASGPLEVARVGKDTGQAFTVIFIHGRGGDRRLGVNDITFGGNFNRLKNLVVASGGTYYAPSVQSFADDGVSTVAALIDHAYVASGGRPVVLACASMGSFICWGITRDPKAAAQLSGMAILGGATDANFTKSIAAKRKLPLWFTHGSRDSVYAATDQIALYDRLHTSGYPARFTLFETGAHGTPVRMSDWRAILSWLIR